MSKLYSYLLHYYDGDDTELYYRCDAEDLAHAVEQLEDHERTLTGSVTFVEVIKRSKYYSVDYREWEDTDENA